MKIFQIIFILLLTTSAFSSPDDGMDERANAVMKSLGIDKNTSQQLTGKTVSPFSTKGIREFSGELHIECKKDIANAEVISSEDLNFKDKSNKVRIVGEIIYTPSADVALHILLEKLAMNSLPLSILSKIYEKKADGPGELCVINRILDQATQKFVPDPNSKRIYFIRGNAVVYLYIIDSELNVEDIASFVDQKLKE